MISDLETNFIYFSELLKTDSEYRSTFKELTDVLDSCNIQYDFLQNTKDIWARDYMPIQAGKDLYIEYRYDPDYLQAKKYRKIKTYPDLVSDSIGLKTKKTDIILDGGNVIKSGTCIILTDKVLSENQESYSKEELFDALRELFEVKKIVFIPWDKENEIYGHADGMLRFIDDSTVLIQGYYKHYPKEFQDRLYGSLTDAGIKWVPIEFDVSKEYPRNWIYLNFLQTEDILIIPKLGIKEDELAFNVIKESFHEYTNKNRIFQVDVNSLLKEGGGLNCASWTIKQNI